MYLVVLGRFIFQRFLSIVFGGAVDQDRNCSESMLSVAVETATADYNSMKIVTIRGRPFGFHSFMN